MLTTSSTYKTIIGSRKRTFRGYVDIYFDGEDNEPTTFTSDDHVISFGSLEEFYTDRNNPLGLVSSNELQLHLANTEGIFNPINPNSIYYGKMLPNLKVMPYIGLLTQSSEEYHEDTYEYISLGEFYTGDWISPGTSLITSIRCVDKMSKYFTGDMPQLPVQEDTSIGEMFELLFSFAGVDEADVEIDASLYTQIRYGWFQGSTLRTALQNLADNSCCSVFVNRAGKFIVHNNYNIKDSSAIYTDYDQLLESETPQKYTKVYSKVSVRYGRPYIGGSEVVYSLGDIQIDQDGLQLVRAEFSSGPVVVIDQIVISDGYGVTLTNFSYGAWDCSFTLANSGGTQTINVTIHGRVIKRTSDIVTLTNDELFALIGHKAITMDPYLIQDKNSAINYGNLILQLVADPYSYIKAELRGDPALEVGDTITIQNPSHYMSLLDMIITKMTIEFDGGLSSHISGISKKSRTILDWSFVSPGLAILVPREVS